jgi:hypothetical protein
MSFGLDWIWEGKCSTGYVRLKWAGPQEGCILVMSGCELTLLSQGSNVVDVKNFTVDEMTFQIEMVMD